MVISVSVSNGYCFSFRELHAKEIPVQKWREAELFVVGLPPSEQFYSPFYVLSSSARGERKRVLFLPPASPRRRRLNIGLSFLRLFGHTSSLDRSAAAKSKSLRAVGKAPCSNIHSFFQF